MASTLDELRFYLHLAAQMRQPRYDLHKLPGPRPYPAVGHIPFVMRPDYHVQMLEWANQYGGIYRFCLGFQWVVVISDPAVAVQVLGRGAGSVPRKCKGYQFFDLATNHLGAHSFFTTSDEPQWAAVRKAAAPAFSSANVKKAFPIVLHHALAMTRSLVADSCAAPPPPAPVAADLAGAASTASDGSLPDAAASAVGASRGWFGWLWGRRGSSGGRAGAPALPPSKEAALTAARPPSLADLRATADALLTASAKDQDQQAQQKQAQQPVKRERRVHLDGASGALVADEDDEDDTLEGGLEPAGPAEAAPAPAAAKAQVPPYVRSAGVAVDIQHPLELALLNVFVEALFDIRPDGFPGQKVADAMTLVLAEANERLKLPLSKLWKNITQPKQQAEVRKAQVTLGQVYGYLYDVIRSRGEPRAGETELWACLARVRDPNTAKLLSKSQLLPEIGAFMMAGFDTSSHSVAWCLYALASHPEVQAKVHAELAEHGLMHGPGLAPRALQYEDLPRLQYLCAVVDETMRMFPVAATASVREVTTPTRVGGYLLPPGVIVWPMLYAMHNAEHNWKEPHIFRPERWLGAKAGGGAAGGAGGASPSLGGAKAFMPFSDGMKSCLGQALGLMEVRACLATMLGRCWLELDPARPAGSIHGSMVMSLTLKMKHGLALLAHPHDPAWGAKCVRLYGKQGSGGEEFAAASGSGTAASSTLHSRSSSVSAALGSAM